VQRFAAETNAVAREIVANGVASRHVEVLYPGIDLTVFRPALPPSSRFRVLFASSPADPGEFDARGIPLLIETARRCPDVEFAFLWRRWGNRVAATEAFDALQPPPNVTVDHVDATNMAAVYASVHVVACCYAPGFGKSAPNSVIEGLACGRPTLLSPDSGLADVVLEGGAGVVAARNPEAVAEAISELQNQYAERCRYARHLAEQLFDINRFRSRYSALYERLATRPTAFRDQAMTAEEREWEEQCESVRRGSSR
jgi:glycosyltransferase involved in cell wall biosynthesis